MAGVKSYFVSHELQRKLVETPLYGTDAGRIKVKFCSNFVLIKFGYYSVNDSPRDVAYPIIFYHTSWKGAVGSSYLGILPVKIAHSPPPPFSNCISVGYRLSEAVT